ncbi:unnamed protein product [Sympodiomycopsis kandeliae]
MVFGLFPSFFGSLESQSGPRDPVFPLERPGSPVGVDRSRKSSGSMIGFGMVNGISTGDFSWSPLLGMKGVHNTSGFSTLPADDALTPGSCSSTSSQGGMLPIEAPSLGLPAWCTTADIIKSLDSDEAPQDPAMSLHQQHQPARTLRRMGRRNVAEASTSTHRGAASVGQAASPDLEGAVETKTVVADPYLYPTPANRPLRQYVSAPVLSEMEGVDAVPSGMTGSVSMDDLLTDLAWTSTSHESAERPGEGSNAGLGSNTDISHSPLDGSFHGLGLDSNGGADEIDGSLYRRRAQHNHGQMPSPSPIHTSMNRQQQVEMQPSQMNSLVTIHEPVSSADGQVESTAGYQERMKQLHELHMRQAAFQRSMTHGFGDGLVTPAQQHLGQHTSEIAARNVQAALLYGQDSPERRNSLDGMSAFDSQGYAKQAAYVPASPYMLSPAQAAHHQAQARFFVYSAPEAGGSRHHPSSMASSGAYGQSTPQQQGVGASYSHHDAEDYNERIRKQSMPNAPFNQHQYDHSRSGNVFAMEGLPSPHHNQPSISRGSIHSVHGRQPEQMHMRPLGQAESVPLMPVSLPMEPRHHPIPSHPWSHAAPPEELQYHQSFSALGAPHSGSSLNSAMPLSAESFASSSTSSVPVTPPSAKRTAEMSFEDRPAAKKCRSSPNLRSPRSGGSVSRREDLLSSSPSNTAVPDTPISPTTGRKIASSRRVQSSKNLRARANSKSSTTSGGNTISASNSPSRAGAGSSGSAASSGFAFVNYGVEDAKELCSAVAPSGSYKVPLKGFGGHSEASPSSAAGTSPRKPTVAGAAAIAAHKRTTPRMPVDTSRWIIETGEDSGDEDDDEDEDDEDMMEKMKRKRTKSGASGSSTSSSKGKGGSKRTSSSNIPLLGEAIVLTSENKKK